MIRRIHSGLVLFALTLTVLVSSPGILGQSIWLDRSANKFISLEILKPNFQGDDETTLGTSAWFLSGRFNSSEQISWVVEVPFAHFDLSSSFGDYEAENALGNIYLGMEIHAKNSPVFGELGVRLPLAPDEDSDNVSASYIGLFTEFVDRAEAFVFDAVPISAALNYHYQHSSGFVFRLRGAPVYWIATKDRDESEFFLLYSAQTGYQSPKFKVLGGFSGRWLTTEEDASFSESSFHQLGLAADVGVGIARPGIYFRLPLDEDLQDMIDFVFGFSLGFSL